jgi:hypothetical protein
VGEKKKDIQGKQSKNIKFSEKKGKSKDKMAFLKC